jgi:hypothetical protein
VGRSLASGFAAFGTGILTLGSRGRLALWLALRILAVAGSGNDMALAKGFFGETPEGTLFGALVRGGGDALECLGRSVSYHAGGKRSYIFRNLLRSC